MYKILQSFLNLLTFHIMCAIIGSMSKRTVTKDGRKFTNRSIVKKADAQPNQWQSTKRQQDWLVYYLDPSHKDTWGNAYQAAIKAGYSESYARNIMSPSVALQWVQQAKNIIRLNPEHLKFALAEIIGNKYEKASDRIAAIKLLGVDQGMFVQKQMIGHVNIQDALNSLE